MRFFSGFMYDGLSRPYTNIKLYTLNIDQYSAFTVGGFWFDLLAIS